MASRPLACRALACLAFEVGALVMRDFTLCVFAASGAGTSASATTAAVNTKSNKVAFKRLISSIGYRLCDPVPARSTNRRPPEPGCRDDGQI